MGMNEFLTILVFILIISIAAYAYERVNKERAGVLAATKSTRQKKDQDI